MRALSLILTNENGETCSYLMHMHRSLSNSVLVSTIHFKGSDRNDHGDGGVGFFDCDVEEHCPLMMILHVN